MTRRFDLARRLEAVYAVDHPAVATRALRAEVHDPAWFLGRQWQLGEHVGDDAASPTVVNVSATETPLTHARPGPDFDPRIAPPETVVEAEPGQWWTIGRRVRVGQALRSAVPPAQRDDPALLLAGLPAPYDRLHDRGLDGLALFRDRVSLGLDDAAFAALRVPLQEPDDDWQPDSLHYRASFAAGSVALEVPRHDGGDVDWYSVTATGTPPADGTPLTRTSHPTRVNYPGAPAPRWWQLDDHRVDPGAVAPQRTQLTALLTIHASATQRGDWFTAPLVVSAGSLVTVRSIEVQDSMDLVEAATPVEDWSLYEVAGLGPQHLLVWPTVSGPVTAPASLDDVLIGVDEDANVLWAVERRVDGVDVTAAENEASGEAEVQRGQIAVTATPRFGYRPSSKLAPFWYPYLLSTDGGRRRFLRGSQADLTARPIAAEDGPASRLLSTPGAAATDPAHVIDPAAIPPRGVRIERRYVLGRRTDGLPVLWVQRRTSALQAPPVSGLLFDVLEPEIPVSAPLG
jgi:hypothetical protein